MNVQLIGAVFERVLDRLRAVRKFAWLADRNETRAECGRNGGSEDESATLGADDDVDRFIPKRIGHQLDREREPSGICEERGDVFEDNARFREIGHVADERSQLRQHRRKGSGMVRGARREECSRTSSNGIVRRGARRYDRAMPDAGDRAQKKQALEIVEPIGKRVLIRKDEDKKITKVGLHLPDKIEIPTITGRVVTVSAEVERDENYPIKQYDRVLFNPKHAIPVDFEGDNRLFVIPVEDVVAVFRREPG